MQRKYTLWVCIGQLSCSFFLYTAEDYNCLSFLTKIAQKYGKQVKINQYEFKIGYYGTKELATYYPKDIIELTDINNQHLNNLYQYLLHGEKDMQFCQLLNKVDHDFKAELLEAYVPLPQALISDVLQRSQLLIFKIIPLRNLVDKLHTAIHHLNELVRASNDKVHLEKNDCIRLNHLRFNISAIKTCADQYNLEHKPIPLTHFTVDDKGKIVSCYTKKNKKYQPLDPKKHRLYVYAKDDSDELMSPYANDEIKIKRLSDNDALFVDTAKMIAYQKAETVECNLIRKLLYNQLQEAYFTKNKSDYLKYNHWLATVKSEKNMARWSVIRFLPNQFYVGKKGDIFFVSQDNDINDEYAWEEVINDKVNQANRAYRVPDIITFEDLSDSLDIQKYNYYLKRYWQEVDHEQLELYKKKWVLFRQEKLPNNTKPAKNKDDNSGNKEDEKLSIKESENHY